MYLLGAFAVVDGGLPLWWAVAAVVVRHALAAPGRAAGLARVHRDPDRALPHVRRLELRRRARVLVAAPAPDLDRVREIRDRDGRRLADAGREHRGLLPLHADAAGHARR